MPDPMSQKAAHPLPRGWWQAFMWYGSALLMTLSRHGFHGGHASAFVTWWFVVCAFLWALTLTANAMEVR